MTSLLHLNPCDNRLQGRLALVTGASGGIGSSCARALAAEGCDVALHYSSSKVSHKRNRYRLIATMHSFPEKKRPVFSLYQSCLQRLNIALLIFHPLKYTGQSRVPRRRTPYPLPNANLRPRIREPLLPRIHPQPSPLGPREPRRHREEPRSYIHLDRQRRTRQTHKGRSGHRRR